MPRVPRKEVVAPGDVAIFHCVNRCVRRAFLCGRDSLTGRSYEHRREWIRARLEFLAGQFGIEVLGFAVMSNHLHVILRSRPDVVAAWTDAEVARRWWNIFPQRRDEHGNPAEPTDADLAMLQTLARLAIIRTRLSDVSWLMRCLAEPIARRANKEDECKGRFWEGRFKCQPLLDETALAACSVYVDLNPIRAGIARTPESSEYTSAHERIHAAQPRAAAGHGAKRPPGGARDEHSKGRNPRRPAAPQSASASRDGWLSPVELDERRGESARRKVIARQDGGQKSRPCPPTGGGLTGDGRRASHRGFLPLTERQYLELLDWTGRQVRRDKRGAIPSDLEPIFTRLQLSGETWIDTVRHFGRWFRRAVGRPDTLAAEAARRGRRWIGGISHSREAFG